MFRFSLPVLRVQCRARPQQWPAVSYVRVEKVDPVHFTLVGEADLWNPDTAFATPALVSRPGSFTDKVAISLATAGGGFYADNAVGFLGDSEVFVTTDSTITQSTFQLDSQGRPVVDSNGNPVLAVRYGDWFHVRNSSGPGGLGVGYSTLGYAVQGKPGQTQVFPHYVQFGRAFDLLPPPPPGFAQR